MSEELKRFYREYLAWVEAGAPLSTVFTETRGLCCNLLDWSKNTYPNRRKYIELSEEQGSLFMAAGLSISFPFHDDDTGEYYRECERDAAHLNPKRLAWVREHAA